MSLKERIFDIGSRGNRIAGKIIPFPLRGRQAMGPEQNVILGEVNQEDTPILESRRPAILEPSRLHEDSDQYYKKILRSRPGLIRIEEKRVERYIAEGKDQVKIDAALERKNRYIDQLAEVRQDTNWTPKSSSQSPAQQESISTTFNPDTTEPIPQETPEAIDQEQLPTPEITAAATTPRGSERWWHVHRWPGRIIEYRRTRVHTTGGGNRGGCLLPFVFAAGVLVAGTAGSWINDYTQSREGQGTPITRAANWIENNTPLEELWPNPMPKVAEVEKRVEVAVPLVKVPVPSGAEISVPQPEVIPYIPPPVDYQTPLNLGQPVFDKTIPSTYSMIAALNGSARVYFPTPDEIVGKPGGIVEQEVFSSTWGKAEAVWYEAVTGQPFNLEDAEERRRDTALYMRKRGTIPSSQLEIAKIYQDILAKTNWYYQGAGFRSGPFLPNHPEIFGHFANINTADSVADAKVCSHDLSADVLRRRACVLNFMIVPSDTQAKAMIEQTRQEYVGIQNIG